MGYDLVHTSVSAHLSRHNDERDKRDDELWEQLQREISDLCDQPRFRDIGPMTF